MSRLNFNLEHAGLFRCENSGCVQIELTKDASPTTHHLQASDGISLPPLPLQQPSTTELLEFKRPPATTTVRPLHSRRQSWHPRPRRRAGLEWPPRPRPRSQTAGPRCPSRGSPAGHERPREWQTRQRRHIAQGRKKQPKEGEGGVS